MKKEKTKKYDDCSDEIYILILMMMRITTVVLMTMMNDFLAGP